MKAEEIVEEYELLSEIRAELATDMYEAQDEETKLLIDSVVKILRSHAEASIFTKVGRSNTSLSVTGETVKQNTLYLAIEIVKDLGLFGYKVGGFVFPEDMCSGCGVTL